ncbi:hypothetical protein SAMN05421863_10416 [Nitrosomonas communis]|uniref:Uncharacterized protein n=1 Tax=Nitrosomonas communis TaxID=44574 RepID=A0A1I4SIL8_9PROT|nr:hypothetical protein SAMN05421863_10416 [Nitrosomonas communis]
MPETDRYRWGKTKRQPGRMDGRKTGEANKPGSDISVVGGSAQPEKSRLAYFRDQGTSLYCGDSGAPSSPNQILPAIWQFKLYKAQNRIVSSDEQKTVSMINNNLISLLNASKRRCKMMPFMALFFGKVSNSYITGE